MKFLVYRSDNVVFVTTLEEERNFLEAREKEEWHLSRNFDREVVQDDCVMIKPGSLVVS